MKQAKLYPFFHLRQKRVQVSINNHDAAHSVPSQRQIIAWVAQALCGEYRFAQIAVVFFPEDEAKVYNQRYRNKNYATNVLSFPLDTADSDSLLCGDLLICPAVIEREAGEQGKTVCQHYAHMIVHGVLHLIGYDHIEENEAEQMEQLEIQLLKQLGYPNPYIEE